MACLVGYERVYGQKINENKICFSMDPKMPLPQRQQIAWVTSFSHKTFLLEYLGCPLYVGRRKSEYFVEISQSIFARVVSWKNHLFSTGGRMVLIKHVLASIPIHLLATTNPTQRVLRHIEKMFAKFFWSASLKNLNYH